MRARGPGIALTQTCRGPIPTSVAAATGGGGGEDEGGQAVAAPDVG